MCVFNRMCEGPGIVICEGEAGVVKRKGTYVMMELTALWSGDPSSILDPIPLGGVRGTREDGECTHLTNTVFSGVEEVARVLVLIQDIPPITSQVEIGADITLS